MPNTYTQIHIHLVFAVKYRASVITSDWEDELHKYMTGIIQAHDHKLLNINGMPDHIHILMGLRPKQALSDIVREVKASSSKWINERGFVKHRFEWQEGFGAFSYGKSDLPKINNYIDNQKIHHAKQSLSFREEYLQFLKAFDIEYDEKYIFHDLL
jgi:REP element-mobilizing transposase RayT